MRDIFGMEVFIRVVKKGSFSAAAQELNLTPSAVSKQVTRIEADLGVRLINRSTHELSLTDAGNVFFERCVRILREIDLARDAVYEANDTLTGVLRLHVTPGTGHQLILPVLRRFLGRYDNLSVDLMVSPTAADILREGLDLSIRSEQGSEPGVHYTSVESRSLFRARYRICASPEYFSRHGRPRTPHDLVDHNCLLYVSQPSYNKWLFTDGKQTYTITVGGHFQADDWSVVRDAAFDGLGIARLLTFDRKQKSRDDRLETIFEKESVCDRTIWAYYPRTPSVPRKVEAFLDFLSDELTAPGDPSPALLGI